MYVLNEKCDGIVECNFYIFELNCSINSKWHFLSCAAIAIRDIVLSTEAAIAIDDATV